MIKPNVITLIRHSGTCKAKLQLALDKSAMTIHRYLDENHVLLTTAAALKVIREQFKLTDSEILEPEPQTA